MININTLSLYGFSAALGLLSFYFYRKELYKIELSSKGVVLCGAAWVSFITLEFWLVGPFSYIYLGDEGIQSFPYYSYLAEHATRGRFNPDILGGVDAYSVFSSGYQLVSVERVLFGALPAWAAIAFHKVFAASLAFVGAYLLARAVAPIPRVMAVAIAGAYTLIFQYMILVSLVHSFGYHLIPLALYVFCYQLDSRFFPLKSFFMGIAVAVTVMPIQGGMPFYPALLILAAFSGAIRHPKFYFALIGMILLHLLNWADTLYALGTFAEFTSRVQEFDRDLTLAKFAGKLQVTQLLIPLVGFGLAFLVAQGRQRVGVLVVFAAPLALSIGMDLVPWKTLNLDFLSGLNYSYFWLSLSVLSIVAMSIVAAEAGNGMSESRENRAVGRQIQNVSFAIILALGPATATYYKTANSLNWLGLGGQANIAAVPNLLEPTWLPKDPVRVAVVPQHFWDTNLLPYGFDTMGGYFVLFSDRIVEFWKQAGIVTSSGRAMLKPPPPSCPGVQRSEEVGDMQLLRIANVRFITSVLPIDGAGLRQVSGPSPVNFRPSCTIPVKEKLMGYLRDRFIPREVYVYDLGEVNPRVYFARAVINTSHTIAMQEYWDIVRAIGPKRGAVIETTQSISIAPRQLTAEIVSWQQVDDGFDIKVMAPQGGVLVINSTYLPFWKASNGEKQLEIFPANGTQMAIVLPPGSERITLSYHRKLPSDFIRKIND